MRDIWSPQHRRRQQKQIARRQWQTAAKSLARKYERGVLAVLALTAAGAGAGFIAPEMFAFKGQAQLSQADIYDRAIKLADPGLEETQGMVIAVEGKPYYLRVVPTQKPARQSVCLQIVDLTLYPGAESPEQLKRRPVMNSVTCPARMRLPVVRNG